LLRRLSIDIEAGRRCVTPNELSEMRPAQQ
jgi:hypothetical protein